MHAAEVIQPAVVVSGSAVAAAARWNSAVQEKVVPISTASCELNGLKNLYRKWEVKTSLKNG